MSTSTPVIYHAPASCLLYALEEDGAVILGCTTPDAAHLEIPPVIEADGVQHRVTAIGESAFAYMTGLQRITLPETLTRIAHGAFEASGLTEIHLHGGMEAVSPYAFFGCMHLTRVTLPASSAFMLEEQAFGGCTALKADSIANHEHYPAGDLQRSGLPAACIQPRVVYVAGDAAPADDPRSPAEQLLDKGIAHEDAGRYAEAADAYMQAHAFRESLGRIANHDRQMAILKAVSEAEYRLALLLKFSLAPVKNPDGTARPAAHELLQLVIDTSSHPDAAYHLGDLYAGGYGLPRDPAHAAALLRQAAAAGHERACLDLGYSCLHGTLGPANPAAALRFFAKCAELEGPYAFIARAEMSSIPPQG